MFSQNAQFFYLRDLDRNTEVSRHDFLRNSLEMKIPRTLNLTEKGTKKQESLEDEAMYVRKKTLEIREIQTYILEETRSTTPIPRRCTLCLLRESRRRGCNACMTPPLSKCLCEYHPCSHLKSALFLSCFACADPVRSQLA